MTRSNTAGSSGGGAATHVGITYQDRVAAWFAVRVLAEQDATPPYLPADVTLDYLKCETFHDVDDILVGTSSGGRIFIQAKHRLELGTTDNSEIASALDQFVRQFVTLNQSGNPLNQTCDRLIIATTSQSSTPIKNDIPAILSRLRSTSGTFKFEDTACNKSERHALNVIRKHIDCSWLEALGTKPSDDEVRQLLGLVRIQLLDVDEEGNDEREAKDRLRNSVLNDPKQVDLAWNTLINACSGFASNRSGADRKGLQQILQDAVIKLEGVRSYRSDIERLKQYSVEVVGDLSVFSKILLGSKEVKISRLPIRELREAAEKDSLTIIGEPGAGKSGVLYDLFQLLWSEGRDVVLLATDHLEAGSLSSLRVEMGLEHGLLEVLDNWIGLQPAILIIDALDAARSEAASQALHDLISRVVSKKGRWHVVVSVRKFDLRYDSQLQSLFRGSPPTPFRDPEFSNIRHIDIRPLENEELLQIPSQSIELGLLLATAGPDLIDLLRVPFNLQLAGELLGEGMSVNDLISIRTHIELLDRYWRKRVVRGDKEGDAREAVLRRIVERMVAERKIRIARADVANDVSVSPALSSLLKFHVLTEWKSSAEAKADRSILAFPHHRLFDYAVSRLLLNNPRELVDRLEKEPDIVLAIRPSIVLRFQEEWWKAGGERQTFWDLVFHLMRSPTTPEVCKLIGPWVAAGLINETTDFQLVIDHLNSDAPDSQKIAEQTLSHLIGAILDTSFNLSRPLIGDKAPPWCQLLELCSRSLRMSVAQIIRPLLTVISDSPEGLTPEQRALVGLAARRIFEFAFGQENVGGYWLIRFSTEAICHTYESDPSASAALIRRLLNPARLKERGYEEMPVLAGQVKRLIEFDTALVGDIYKAVFTYREESTDSTQIGGALLPLGSNRKQDYELAGYELAGIYSTFLRKDSIRATEALVKAIEFYTDNEHLSDTQGCIEESFDFNGHVATIRTDYSLIWDRGSVYSSDEPVKMLDTFESYLRELSENNDKQDERRTLVNIIGAENRHAGMWRRLLICGASAPATLGIDLRELAWAVPILNSYDTSKAYGDFIAAIFSHLNPSEREKAERAIMSIADPVDELHWTVRERNSLLVRLPIDLIVTDEARQIRASLDSTSGTSLLDNAAWDDEEMASPDQARVEPYTDGDYLANKGVAIKTIANRNIQELSAPVRQFRDSNYDSPPALEDIDNVLPALRSLHHALRTADEDGVDSQQRDFGWMYLVNACKKAIKNDEFTCETNAGVFIKDVLLEAACQPVPVYDPLLDKDFDEHATAAIPAPRAHAAEALAQLARHSSCVDERLLETINKLSRDEAPAVRFEVAENILNLYYSAPDLMWDIFGRLCKEEQRRGILRHLISGPVAHLAPYQPDRVAELTHIVFNRIEDGVGATEVRKACASIFNGLYLWQGNESCGTTIFEIATNPLDYADIAQRVVYDIRQCLAHGPDNPPKEAEKAIRQRGFKLLGSMLSATRDEIRSKEKKLQESKFSEWPETEQEQLRKLLSLADWLGAQVYFASGAYTSGGTDEEKLGVPERRRFLAEADAVIEDLIDLGLPKVAHNLLKLFESAIDFDPRKVLLRIARTVRASRANGYQYDPMAANLVVSLVERFLAKYRYLLQDDDECRKAIVEVLDVFVEPGWPGARRLSYNLDIHR